MGHQDSDLELRALYSQEPAPEAKPVEEAPLTPLAIDHDAVPSWRETARFFRRAA